MEGNKQIGIAPGGDGNLFGQSFDCRGVSGDWSSVTVARVFWEEKETPEHGRRLMMTVACQRLEHGGRCQARRDIDGRIIEDDVCIRLKAVTRKISE